MTSIVEKIQKRRCYPVPIENGETLHVRPLRWPEQFALSKVESLEDKVVFRLGCCLVEENGDRAFPIGDTESVAEFIARVRNTTTDLTYEDITALLGAITKVTKTPPAETVEKNSEATAAAAG